MLNGTNVQTLLPLFTYGMSMAQNEHYALWLVCLADAVDDDDGQGQSRHSTHLVVSDDSSHN